MGTLNDEILRVTGGPTVQDGLRAWFLLKGATVTTGPLQDIERSFLATKVIPSDGYTNEDLWMQYLGDLLHTGTLNDRLLQFWTAEIPI